MDGSQTVGQGPMGVYEDFLRGPWLVPTPWVGDPWIVTEGKRVTKGRRCIFVE